MKRNQTGYTLVEMLVVVGIISILASLATPAFLTHIKRARASEAVASMYMIRQSIKDYYINHGSYFDVASDHIQDQPTTGVDVNLGVTKYFSNAAFTVDGTSPSSARFSLPSATDFIITATGNNSVACGSSNCALSKSAVANFILEMDNTARIYVSYDNGTSWSQY